MSKTNLIIALALIVLSLGCKQRSISKETKNETVKEVKTLQNVDLKYETVESLLQQAESLSEKTVHVSGVIEHVCKHGGKRFKIISTDGAIELKIELGENLEAVGADIIGNTAMVTGILKSNNMDAEMVKAWENKMKKNHAGEEDTGHYQQELAEIQEIYQQIVSGEIPYYTEYSLQAEKYELQ